MFGQATDDLLILAPPAGKSRYGPNFMQVAHEPAE